MSTFPLSCSKVDMTPLWEHPASLLSRKYVSYTLLKLGIMLVNQ